MLMFSMSTSWFSTNDGMLKSTMFVKGECKTRWVGVRAGSVFDSGSRASACVSARQSPNAQTSVDRNSQHRRERASSGAVAHQNNIVDAELVDHVSVRLGIMDQLELRSESDERTSRASCRAAGNALEGSVAFRKLGARKQLAISFRTF